MLKLKGKARERDTSIEKLKARGVLLLTEGKPGNAKSNIILGKINSWRELEDFIKGKARERDTSIEKLKARGVLLLTEGKPEMKMNPSINNANSDLKKADPSKEIATMKPNNETKDDNEEDNNQNQRKIIASI